MFSIARIIGICLGVPLLLGYLMYLQYHGYIESAYFVTTLLSVWGVAAIPRRFYQSSAFARYSARIICVCAVISTIPMVYKDITLVNGADLAAVVLRTIIATVVIIMFLETFKKSTI